MFVNFIKSKTFLYIYKKTSFYPPPSPFFNLAVQKISVAPKTVLAATEIL